MPMSTGTCAPSWASPQLLQHLSKASFSTQVPPLISPSATPTLLAFRLFPPHSVCGIGGSHISAVGVSTVNLCLGGDANLVLHHILYVPDLHVQLISIPALCDDGNFVATFNSSSCSIHTCRSLLVTTGSKTGHCALYHLHCKPIFAHQANVAQHASSLAT